MQNEGRESTRKGADIEERLLEFAVRVGKAVDALPSTRLGRHIVGQLYRMPTHFAFSSLHYSLIISFLAQRQLAAMPNEQAVSKSWLVKRWCQVALSDLIRKRRGEAGMINI